MADRAFSYNAVTLGDWVMAAVRAGKMRILTLLLILCSSTALAQVKLDSDRWMEWSPKERVDAFRQIDLPGLKTLKAGESDSFALQSAWKLTTDVMHKARRDRPGSRDRRPLYNFLGFVEGRTHINLPVWFQRTVVSATATANSLPSVSPREVVRPKMFDVAESISSVRDISLREKDGHYVVATRTHSITLPDSMLHQSSQGLYGDIDCLTTKKYAFISTGDASTSCSHDVCCIDLESNSVQWKTESVAGYYGALGGYSEGLHEMLLNDGRLFLICASHCGFFLQCFDVETGKSLIQFSTEFSP